MPNPLAPELGNNQPNHDSCEPETAARCSEQENSQRMAKNIRGVVKHQRISTKHVEQAGHFYQQGHKTSSILIKGS